MDETRNYFLQEISQNESMSMKAQKGFCNSKLYWILLILASTITECISISAFASLIGIPIAIASSVIRLKICAVAARIKRYKSIIKKKKKNHDKIVLLAKSKLNSLELLISKALIDFKY